MRASRPWQLLSLAAILVMATTGCARVTGTGAPGAPSGPEAGEAPEAVPARSVWGGTITLAAQELPTVLETQARTPPRHSLILRIPELGMEARGEGSWSGDRIRGELAYGGDTACPGTIELDVRVSEDGERARGDLTARDCTGSESGPVELLRREAIGRSGSRLR